MHQATIITELKMVPRHPPIPVYQKWEGEYKGEYIVVENPVNENGCWRWYIPFDMDAAHHSVNKDYTTKEDAMTDVKKFIDGGLKDEDLATCC